MTRLLPFLAASVLLTRQGAAQAAPELFLNINPSWAPDGRRLVFESSRHGNVELYVINADGTGERRLTYSPSNVVNSHASWSPDGSSIVFDSFRGAFHLYVIRPDGSGERRLTQGEGGGVQEFARHPEWSPDGRLIAFDSRRDGNGEYYVIQPDGAGLRRLTNTPDVQESHPTWTPDGELILSAVAGETRTLLGLDPTTGRTRPLFETPANRSSIAISPDRRRYFFRSSADSTPRLHIATLDGAVIAAITPRGNTSYEAAWSPDGSKVAFYYDIGGAHQLFVVDADGRNLRQLTRTAATVNRVSLAFIQLAREGAFSGVLLVADRDTIQYFRAFGLADSASRTPLTPETPFPIASLIKPLVSVAAARLVEEGKLSWDDPLSRFFAGALPDSVAHLVRVKHLLTHTSGLREVVTLPQSPRTVDDYVAAALAPQRNGLAYSPGTRSQYTNANFLLLAKIIEARAGQPFYTYVREAVFRPAGMVETRFDTSAGYPPAHCCATSTARDLWRFAHALQGGRIVRPATVEVMLTPKPEAGSWGYGFDLLGDTAGVASHGGSWIGQSHALELFRRAGYTVIILSNRTDGRSPLRERIREIMARP